MVIKDYPQIETELINYGITLVSCGWSRLVSWDNVYWLAILISPYKLTYSQVLEVRMWTSLGSYYSIYNNPKLPTKIKETTLSLVYMMFLRHRVDEQESQIFLSLMKYLVLMKWFVNSRMRLIFLLMLLNYV